MTVLRNRFAAALGAVSAAVFLVGPALAGEMAKADPAAPDPRLGEEVNQICFARNINNFSTIKGEDNAALLQANVNDWYKVSLIGPCSASRLNFAQSVAIEQHPSGASCITKGDYLIFSDSAFGRTNPGGTSRCAISAMYKWNPKAKAEDAAPPANEN